MEKIIIVLNGSHAEDADHLKTFTNLIHDAIHPGCTKQCVKAASLQHAKPSLSQATKDFIEEDTKKIIISPFFLHSETHITADIAAAIEKNRTKYPDIEFVYAEPLGFSEKIVNDITDRLNAEQRLKPYEIEEKSFQIISEESALYNKPVEQLPIIIRVIHATADFELGKSLLFHPDAIQKAKELIKAGKDILVDVEMLRAGISSKKLKRFGADVRCYINDPEIAKLSQKTDMTRSELAIEKGITENNIGIVAIGNAPTALLKTIEIMKRCDAAKEMVCIGVPVGFVKALESKILLSCQSFPFITNLSRKGGSPVASAIVNSLIKTCIEEGQIDSF